jgi:hypothetical protein
MLKVTFELTSAAAEEPVDGLSQGHMSFCAGEDCITSKTKDDRQSMYIFPSLVLLLDRLLPFLTNPNARSLDISVIDSSFGFDVRRTSRARIALLAKGIQLDGGTPQEVASAIWDEASRFVTEYLRALQNDDLVSDDLRASMREFRDALPIVR